MISAVGMVILKYSIFLARVSGDGSAAGLLSLLLLLSLLFFLFFWFCCLPGGP